MNKITIPTYNVQKLEREIQNGKTNPLLFQTDRGFFVVKSKDNVDGSKVLVNEFICYKLAKLLGVPIPDAALINIDKKTIEADQVLMKKNISPGLHFGSEFVKKAQPSVQPPLIDIINNQEDIPSIILFDQIIYNNDRTENQGNLLIDLKEKRILAIDHSHPFKLGVLWNSEELSKIQKEKICLVRDFHGQNYRVLLRYVNGHSPFNKIRSLINGIKFEHIDWCFEQLPEEEWDLNIEDKIALKEFIWHRINNVEHLLLLLKDQCPNWKGGELIE
ncbi:hypothetical protein GLV94_05415 [Virgibacillus halodenitrificans]|uniref:HipA family kinase n=1 Tax=Virgibacillus halodenitrificans TaxID=1482 RepID=UPI001368D246|nr:HipA family kinase [Virgibacillus halodenitrificans]MYL45074.1 hypothetical protein [Virgibacillus halodenitrificans]